MISWTAIGEGWNYFFFRPEDPFSLAVVRILVGLICALNALTRLMAAPELYAPDSMIPWRLYKESIGWPRLSLLKLMPVTIQSVRLVILLELVSSIFFTMGFMTRASCIVLYVSMTTLHHRSMDMLDASDTIVRMFVFLLCLCPSGAALSLEILLFPSWRLSEIAPWGLRLLQIQVSLIYIQSVRLKWTGPLWRDGTAVWYPLQLERFVRIPYPRRLLGNRYVLRSLTWGVLLAELAVGTLIWIEELRVLVVIVGLLLHIGFGAFLQLRLFSYVMCAGLVSFLPSSIFRSLISSVVNW